MSGRSCILTGFVSLETEVFLDHFVEEMQKI